MSESSMHLSESSCEACRADAPRLSTGELEQLMPQVPEWQLLTVDDIPRIQRVYAFRNFVEALAFANRVGELAEAESHHPALLVEWGRVTVQWWTHKISGLHRNDLIMAAKTDLLL